MAFTQLGKFDSYFEDIIPNLMVQLTLVTEFSNEVYAEAMSIPFEISQNTAVEHPASGK